MKSEIRVATEGDAPAIAAINNAVFPKAETTAEHVAAVLRTNHRATQVATVGNQVVGFVDGFATPRDKGAVWNVDLLAVHPDFHGNRLGRLLIARNFAAGLHRTPTARALIHVDNLASQRAFLACGFTVQSAVCTLVVKPIAHPPKAVTLCPPHGVKLLPITTLNYSGSWVEPAQAGQKAAAVTLCTERSMMGIVIPMTHQHYLASALRADFVSIGPYQWWTRCAI